MSHYNGCGCGGGCNSCTSHNEIQQAVNDALALEKENLEQYENNAAQSASDAANEAAKSAESASAAAQSQANAETAAGTATQAASSVTDTAIVLEETAERIEQAQDLLEQAQDLLEEQISALQTKPVYFEVSTPTNTLVLPETETVFNVRSIYIASARQDVGYGFTFDKATRTITLADGITADDIAESEAGFILITAICDVYNSDDPTSFPLILASNVGANNVGTSTGATVETRLENADEAIAAISAPTGLNKVGAVSSFSALRAIVPELAGQIINLRSHQEGWAAQVHQPVGGGEFVAIAGSAVNDGGYICVPEGQSSFYWMRVLGSNEYLTPQMYGYITGYSDSTETGMELKPYIQAAIDTSIAIGKSKVLLPDGDYYSAIGNFELAGTGHNRSAGVLVFGENPAHTKMGTRIYFDAPELTSPLFVSKSPSSVHTGQHIDDLWLGTPMSKRYRGVALSLVGTCHMLSQRVHVERLYDGINLLNTRSLATDNSEGDENGYCELNTFRDWTINKCVNAISFNNDGTGDPSLHGTSFQNCFIQLKEDGNGLYFKGLSGGLMWYNSTGNTIKFWGGADDTTTCQLIRLEGTEVRGVSGQMTWEGRGRISCDQYSWWRFNGDIFGIPSTLAMIDYSGVVSESYLGDARVAFNNTTSKDRVAMSNPVMSGFYMRPLMPFSRAAKRTTNIPVAMPVRITSSPLEFPTDTSNYEGIAFPTFHNGGAWFGEVVNRSVWSAMTPSMKIESSNGSISNYYGSGMTLYNFTVNGVALSNPGWTFGNNIYPLSPEGGGIGTDSNRVSSLYTKSVQITASGIFPRTNKGANIGAPGGSFNNIYLENSPIITSDEKDKYGYVGLSEEEIKCAIACAKLYRRYQMKEAVIEKGEDQARFHIGVIAQDLIECFTQHGLDWTRYGIFIYQKVEYRPAVIESWEDEWIDVPEEKDDDGNIIKEASRYLRRAAGSITLEPAVEAGEYYKLRYDELNCFINAGLCARLEALEDKLS